MSKALRLKSNTCILVICAMVMPASFAELYIYDGPGGVKLITDRPVKDRAYRLVTNKANFQNAGRIIANRPISTGGPQRFQKYITVAGNRFGVDPALIEAVIQVESGFDPNAVSRTGAAGLMQLMDDTAVRYRVRNSFNPRQNINAGVEHLSYLMNRFNGKLPLVLAAYNAGATTVDRYRGIPPYPETRNYVTKVLMFHRHFRRSRYGL